MKKILIILIILLNICYSAKADEITIDNHKFVSADGYLYIDLSTYKYNKFLDKYSADIIYEINDKGDYKGFSCPAGNGYISHFIFSVNYSHKKKTFNKKYKGFICSEYTTKYNDNVPVSDYITNQKIYYDSDTDLIPHYDKNIFNELNFNIDYDKNNFLNFFNKVLVFF